MSTLQKSLDILELFLDKDAGDGYTLTGLSERANVNISTLFRIVQIFMNNGYLIQPKKRGGYYLGFKFSEFSELIKGKYNIGQLALPLMRDLNKKTLESINMAILDGNEAVYIGHLESTYSLRTFTYIGNRVPLYATGVGKILLSAFSDDEVDTIYNSNLYTYTNSTISTVEQLKHELDIIRKEGVAIDNEEMEKGVRCVATAIKDRNSKIIAALSISGPSIRINTKNEKYLLKIVKRYGINISSLLGFKK